MQAVWSGGDKKGPGPVAGPGLFAGSGEIA